MLSPIRVLFSAVTVFILLLGSLSYATPPKGKLLPLEPVWERVDGHWKFNNSKTADRQILIHITSSRTNTANKKLLIKDLVKLPFVVFIERDQLETSSK